ncbi:cysteine synthase A [Anaerotignum sp.]|uniref:cysteine synthase A n=1 Tax=Anaerotignum sp. TaxID=2039241 RepID=UPI003316DA77
MIMIYSSIEQLIGKTPLLELVQLEKKYHLKAKLIAKVEFMNPGGSAKDRVAKAMIEEAESKGILKEGATIIEPTSGNTGIGLAVMAAAKGYRAIIVMPDSMSMERRMLMKAFGAELVLSDGSKGMAGAIEKAEELNKEIPNSFIPGQFDNLANPQAHYETTGPEIYKDTEGKIDIFVSGVGTGGTITGVGKYLKEKNGDIQVVAVEPAKSPLLSKGIVGSHGIQGIGANFVPSILNTEIYDEIIAVENEDAYEMGREIAKTEGLLVGISSGAAVVAAMKLAHRPENMGKNIVVLLPDTGERYLTTAMFTEE